MVIRLGKRFGFRTLNVVRRAEQVQPLKSIGAGAVIVFDPDQHHADRLRDEVRNVTQSDGVQYAIDPVAGSTGSALLSCLGRGGRMLVYGTMSNEPLSFSSRTLMTPGASIEGFWLGGWIQTQNVVTKLRLVKTITRLIRAGVLASEVGQSFRLDEIHDAVREAEKPAARRQSPVAHRRLIDGRPQAHGKHSVDRTSPGRELSQKLPPPFAHSSPRRGRPR